MRDIAAAKHTKVSFCVQISWLKPLASESVVPAISLWFKKNVSKINFDPRFTALKVLKSSQTASIIRAIVQIQYMGYNSKSTLESIAERDVCSIAATPLRFRGKVYPVKSACFIRYCASYG